MNDLQKELLDTLKTPIEVPKKPSTELTKAEKNYEHDYEYTRKKLKELIDQGGEGVEQLLRIALETKEPSAFRVLSELLATMGGLTTSVIENAEKKSHIDKNVSTANGPSKITQNNAIYVGSTHELLKILNKQDEEIIDVQAEVVKTE